MLLVVLAGCSGGDGNDGTRAVVTTSGGAETTRIVPECRADDANPEELGALVAYEVPDGFRLQPPAAGDTGPSDLAKAIRDDQAEGAERALRDARFRRGYQWLWTNDRDDEIIVFLYEFCAPEGARAYVDRAVGELRRSPLEPIGSLTVPGVEGFRGEQRASGSWAWSPRRGPTTSTWWPTARPLPSRSKS